VADLQYVSPGELATALSQIPAGKDGTNGTNGLDGKAGIDGINGKDGLPGTNGTNGVDGKDGLPGSSSGTSHELWLDDMPGTNDDDKLDAAIAQMSNGNVTRPIRLSPRAHTINKSRVLKDGFKLIATGIGSQPRGAHSIPCQVNWTGTGSMFTLDHSTFDIQFEGIGFLATAKGSFLTGGSNVLWTSYFHNLGFVGFNGVYGTATSKLLNTACVWGGWHNINNAAGTSINLGGSDSSMHFERFLIDTPAGGMDPTQFHIIFDHQQKTSVTGIYLTCDNAQGMRVSNSPNDGAMTFTNCVFEGRNAGQPSANQIVRVESGRVKFLGCQFDFAKIGIPHITQTGGDIQLLGCDFLAANGWTGPVLTHGAGTATMGATTAAFGTPTIA
jgi:hypothetical protein